MSKWIPVDTPPPVIDDDYSYSSAPVLGYFKRGGMSIVTFQTYPEDEYPSAWYTSDSERWDMTHEIAYWMPLPAPPEKGE